MPAVRPSLQAVFTLLLGPFAFFNAQKTKYLQMLTSLMRWMGKNKPCFLSSIWSKIILLQTGFPAFHLSLFVLFAFFSFSSSLLFSSIHMHFPCPPPPPISSPSPVWQPVQVRPSWFGPARCLWLPSPHSSAWQAWQTVPSLIGPSVRGRRAKRNQPAAVEITAESPRPPHASAR